MSNRPYPYYPAWDGKQTQPVTIKLVELCGKRWGMTSLGTYANRAMRNGAGLSVHATGYAADLKYKDEQQARIVWDWFLANSKALGLCELHWYAYGSYGAGYRCSRGEGKAGVKIFTADDNAGSYEGNPNWLHIELVNQTPEHFEEVFRALK
ncbi:hypothetical protein UFOVP556_9 [uncultured Caudovirales phage]|uniref:Uncharacterized protein n=1 Tax=uncultured Caudovirales phage TaxID=2100421 RepID=A0A6J5MT19_9CAUD|nr:hypothetical protein UFOVP556_9 [uncultured Caudovirales phage]